jgi:hypothetical protein
VVVTENPRFISIKHCASVTPGDTTCNVVVSDAANWMQIRDLIGPWMDENAPGWRMKGMVLTFPDEATRLMFMMRWS